MWFDAQKQAVYRSHSEIRQAFPNVSFPSVMSEQDIAGVGLVSVQPTDAPTVYPLTQKAVEVLPQQAGGVWVQAWQVVDLTPEEQTQAAGVVLEDYADHLTAYLDQVAAWKRYDSRINCAVRAGYPGPFQQEGTAFASWMDACNDLAYQVLAEVQAGTRLLPSKAEFLGLMPTAPWGPPGAPGQIPVTTP